MQKLLFTTLLLSLICAAACKRDSKSNDTPNAPLTANPDLLGGDWIAIDFCSRAHQYGSVLEAMNNAHIPYAYAITFNPGEPDSVTCYNGFESWKLQVKYLADTLELVGARPGKSVFLVYDSQHDKDLTMFDATTGQVNLDKFIKSKAGAKDGYASFQVALNHNVFGGLFTLQGKGATGDIQFTPGGFIQGLKDYDRYEICAGGDCFVAGQDIDVVTLSNSKVANSAKFFGYRYSAQNDTLAIFNLVNTNPEEKDAHKIGSKAYTLTRKKKES
ncbi:MAG: hypothetical protein KF734_02500 [Saprospiraceae bacterium]|nr:hypothetical protein [Saprospiraceae bacterium]